MTEVVEEDCAAGLTAEVEQKAVSVVHCEGVSFATNSGGSASPKSKRTRRKRKFYLYTVSAVKITEAHEVAIRHKEVFWM